VTADAVPGAAFDARTPRTTFESDLWPALRGFWHPVAESANVDPGPTAARLLGENLMLVRLDGVLRCFEDLCIHRGTPLSLGWIEAGHVVCAYHGWEYDADGRCVRIPALEDDRSIPRKARTRTFRVTERYGLVWVCLADEATTDIAPFHEFDDASYTTYAAPSLVRTCSAARQVENFMDESHFAWVHEGILGDRLHAKAPAFDVTRDRYSLEFGWDERPNAIHPPGHWRQYTVQLPFTIHLQQRRHQGDEIETLYFAVCPSGAKESTGFLLIARNYMLPPDQEEERRRLTATVGAQDRRIVEAQRPEQVPFDLAAELHIKGPDTAAVAYRRAMAELGVIVDS
jgi:phenylpropionate dioxygenase-like ring-hydroxylating dioxygenase large terminal subunit